MSGRSLDPHTESADIVRLRHSSSYLRHHLGAASPDLWSTVALSFWNIALNWFIVLPAICVAVLSLKVLAVISDLLTRTAGHAFIHIPFAVVGIGLLIGANVVSVHYRYCHVPAVVTGKDAARSFPVWIFVMLSLLSAFAITQFLASDYFDANFLVNDPAGKVVKDASGKLQLASSKESLLALGGVLGAVLYSLSWLAASRRRAGVRDLMPWSLAGFVYGAIVAFGFCTYLAIPEEQCKINLFCDVVMHLVFGVPLVLFAQVVALGIIISLTGHKDEIAPGREFLGSIAGWLLAAALGWFIIMTFTFGGFLKFLELETIVKLYKNFGNWLAPIGGLSGILTAIIGRSAASKAKGGREGVGNLALTITLAIAAPVFAAALIFGSSLWLDNVLLGEPLLTERFPKMIVAHNLTPPDFSIWKATLTSMLLGFVALGALIVASRFIDINEISLHALYRYRLARAILAREDRSANLSSLWPQRLRPEQPPSGSRPCGDSVGWRPFHLLNMTANFASETERGWTKRDVASFTASPLHCGIGSRRRGIGASDGSVNGKPIGAYRYSYEYGGAIALSTAMAISGAAASPNFGYHSSPGVSFLMTLLNARLGWWLGNPGIEGEQTYRRTGPMLAIGPLIQQIFGLDTYNRGYVYVSDGGHFEALGLYEMVRRRCRYIVVVDATCDARFAFEELANSMRKITADFTVPIRFRHLDRLKKRARGVKGTRGPLYDLGEIDYSFADGGGEKGTILYLKPMLFGLENAAIGSYSKANSAFPHENTSNAEFTDAQFESYRALGFEIMDAILTCGLAGAKAPEDRTVGAIFAGLTEGSARARRQLAQP